MIRLLAVLLLSGCAGYNVAEVSLGQDLGITQSWRGDGPLVQVRVRRISDDSFRFCEAGHISSAGSGWPVNDRSETTLDYFSCGLSIGGRR